MGREAKDRQRRERAREQLLKVNQRKREEKARGLIQWNPSLRTPLKRRHLSNKDTFSFPKNSFLHAI